MNLKQNLNFLGFAVDTLIASIDEASNGRLRNPSHSLIKDCPLNTIKEVASVSENIFDIATRSHLRFDTLLPVSDLREFGIVPILDSLDFVSE